jgi:hypothetical protein
MTFLRSPFGSALLALTAFCVSACGKYGFPVESEYAPLFHETPPFMVRIVDDQEVFRGTGFLVSPRGLVLTVSHVVRYDNPIHAILNGRTYLAETVFDDPILDITLIRLPLDEAVPASAVPCLWDSDSVRNGDTVLIFGQHRQGGVGMLPGYMISWSSFRIWPGTYNDVLRIHPADIANSPMPGFSGGPIFDVRRNVIGLFCCLESLQDHYYNGIPSSRILSRLRETELIKEICVGTDNVTFPLPGLILDIKHL